MAKVQHLHVQTACVTVIFKTPGLIRLSRIPYTNLACSQTLYFLFKVSRTRVIKYKPQGIY